MAIFKTVITGGILAAVTSVAGAASADTWRYAFEEALD
ncbi:hypothetical protein LCGC14_2554610, partial [marine sediment metagenome]